MKICYRSTRLQTSNDDSTSGVGKSY